MDRQQRSLAMVMEVGDDGTVELSQLGYCWNKTGSYNKRSTCHARLTAPHMACVHSLYTGARQRCACILV